MFGSLYFSLILLVLFSNVLFFLGMSSVFNQVKHPYHLVTPSPWPFLGSFSALGFVVGLAGFMNNYHGSLYLTFFGFFCILFTMFVWWRDIIREGTFEGAHTKKVQAGLRFGVILFIVSEVMFFFSFFWTFFHSSLAPAIEIGQSWPPLEISVLSPWGIPLLNTVILLTSGATITVCHHGIVWGAKKISVQYLGLTIGLAVFFILFQAFEYLNAPFTISDSVYGSIFFMTTGFHGFHVAIGTIYLVVCYFRLSADHFTRTHHIGFLGAAWYWHLCAVVLFFP